MKEQFVTYEIALKLKELGFNEWCLAYQNNTLIIYDNEEFSKNSQFEGNTIVIPLWQQVIDWFRDKYNLLIILDPRSATTDLTWVYAIVYKKNMTEFSVHYYNYYQAREQAILKAIELCQKEK